MLAIRINPWYRSTNSGLQARYATKTATHISTNPLGMLIKDRLAINASISESIMGNPLRPTQTIIGSKRNTNKALYLLKLAPYQRMSVSDSFTSHIPAGSDQLRNRYRHRPGTLLCISIQTDSLHRVLSDHRKRSGCVSFP